MNGFGDDDFDAGSEFPFSNNELTYNDGVNEDTHVCVEWKMENWNKENSFSTFISFSPVSFSLHLLRNDAFPFSVSIKSFEIQENEEYDFQFTMYSQHENDNFTKKIRLKFSKELEENIVDFDIQQKIVTMKYVTFDTLEMTVQIDSPINETMLSTVFSETSQYILNQIDESKQSPYAGLKNQGSTCYMNSLLQALFHLPIFRRLVFEFEIKEKNEAQNIPLNLKILFAQLQLSKEAASTEALTTSFGWDSMRTVMQHDIQEFCRVLLSNLEDKLKGTHLENTIKYIFGGSYRTYTKGIYKIFVSSQINEFYDLSLQIRDCHNIKESFNKYTEKELLVGENQYVSDQYGKQDAEIGVEFIEFPRVLYLHLRRFEIDSSGHCVKINSQFEFEERMNLSSYIAADIDPVRDNIYDLFGVLVHSGSSLSGHYYAYIRPTCENRWFEFNDSVVKEVDSETAINNNFGGNDKKFSAYMLIYVNRQEENELYKQVADEVISLDIIDRLFRIQEKKDNISYHFFTDKTTIIKNAKKGSLCFNCDKKDAIVKDFPKDTTNHQLYETVSHIFNVSEDRKDLIELWQFTPYGLVDKIGNDIQKIIPFSTQLFVYIPNQNDSFNYEFNLFEIDWPSTTIIFVFFFCNRANPPLRHLFTRKVPYNNFFDDLNIEIKKHLKIDENTPLTINWLKSNSLIEVKKNATSLPDFGRCSTFVAECKNFNDVDLLHFSSDDYFDKKEENKTEDIYSFLDTVTLDDYDATKYYSYVNDTNIVIAQVIGEKKLVRYPNFINFSDFCIFLSIIFHGNNILLFKNHNTKPIIAKDNDVMNFLIFSQDKKINIVFTNEPFPDISRIVRFEISFSFDSINIDFSSEELFSSDETVSDVINRIKVKCVKFNNPRALLIQKRKIVQVLKENEELCILSNSIRIEQIPYEQIDAELFIGVSFSKGINHAPFLETKRAIKISEFKTYLKKKIGFSKEESAKIVFRFYSIENKESTPKDDDNIKDLVWLHEIVIDGRNEKLPKTTDRSVHLYN